jgi:hypothetical protein
VYFIQKVPHQSALPIHVNKNLKDKRELTDENLRIRSTSRKEFEQADATIFKKLEILK